MHVVAVVLAEADIDVAYEATTFYLTHAGQHHLIIHHASSKSKDKLFHCNTTKVYQEPYTRGSKSPGRNQIHVRPGVLRLSTPSPSP